VSPWAAARHVLPLTLLACAATPMPRPAPVAPPPSAFELAHGLATEVGPRLAGSSGDARAVAWALSRMRTLGFSNVHAEPVVVPVWQRGVESLQVLGANPKPIRVTQLGWTPATPKGAGVVGELLVFDSLSAAEALEPGAARGKILLFNVPMSRHADGHGYGDAVTVRYRAGTEGLRLGAQAALIRSIGTDTQNLVHTGSAGRDAPAVPTAAIGALDADDLALQSRKGPVQLQLQLQSARGNDVPSANVVGDVPGTTRKDEIVLLAAHLDSWDLAQGATDDGAGIGFVLAAAQSLVAAPPARTVRVVLFAAEENSLSGAKAYAAAHAGELTQHVVALEMDAGAGAPTEVRLLPAVGAAQQVVRDAMTTLGVSVSVVPAEGGADISPLRAAGVPIVDLRQDMTAYFDLHHTQEDTADKLDRNTMDQTSRALQLLVRQLAAPSFAPGRVPDAQRVRKR
jgi:carboxypeptidase Q